MAPSPNLTSENTASEPDFDIIGEDEVSAARQDEKENEENEQESQPEESSRYVLPYLSLQDVRYCDRWLRKQGQKSFESAGNIWVLRKFTSM